MPHGWAGWLASRKEDYIVCQEGAMEARKMRLELMYEISVDENGVFDGMELAEELIGDAYRHLAPYTRACPACTDALFTAIANKAIDEAHAAENLGGSILTTGEGDSGALFDAHREATFAKTKELLEKGGIDVHRH
jgi:hypothetical protein